MANNNEVKDKLLALVGIKQKVRKLCDKYEQDLFMFVVDDNHVDGNDDDDAKQQMSLMRAIEQRTFRRVISDLENILKTTKQI